MGLKDTTWRYFLKYSDAVDDGSGPWWRCTRNDSLEPVDCMASWITRSIVSEIALTILRLPSTSLVAQVQSWNLMSLDILDVFFGDIVPLSYQNQQAYSTIFHWNSIFRPPATFQKRTMNGLGSLGCFQELKWIGWMDTVEPQQIKVPWVVVVGGKTFPWPTSWRLLLLEVTERGHGMIGGLHHICL